jgi:hypothetical protein
VPPGATLKYGVVDDTSVIVVSGIVYVRELLVNVWFTVQDLGISFFFVPLSCDMNELAILNTTAHESHKIVFLMVKRFWDKKIMYHFKVLITVRFISDI